MGEEKGTSQNPNNKQQLPNNNKESKKDKQVSREKAETVDALQLESHLRYAPTQWKKLMETASPQAQKKLIDAIEFLENGNVRVQVTLKHPTLKVEKQAKLTLSNTLAAFSDAEVAGVEGATNKNGVTYMTKDAIKKLIPQEVRLTGNHIAAIAKLMPESDYKLNELTNALFQFDMLIGGIPKMGYIDNKENEFGKTEKQDENQVSAYIMTPTPPVQGGVVQNENQLMLHVLDTKARLRNVQSHIQAPTLRMAQPIERL